MNNIRHNELLIGAGKPFEYCKLGREKYADVLTSIVSTYADGFVLAINNEWGAGKTTFVKMWEQKLKDDKYKTLYFNAWENDFDANPLVALLAELKTVSDSKGEAQFRDLVKKSTVIAKSIIPSVAKAIVKRYVDTEEIADAIERTVEGAADVLKEEVDEFAQKKQGLKDFRKKLEQYVRVTAGEKPLIFIIDELDRCRPSYAVELLEQIKHFFSVPGIVFVLSIDKAQLENAVRGFYGNDRIDADEYLRRFIDLEYNLPKPDSKSYVEYLTEYFGFQDFFRSRAKKQREFDNDEGDFMKIMTSLFEHSKISLRKMEKLFSHARIGLKTINERQYAQVWPYCMIAYIKTFAPDKYSSIKNKELNYQEFVNLVRTFFPNQIDEYEVRVHVWMEALLAIMYANYCKEYSAKDLLMISGQDSTVSSPINSGFIQARSNQFVEALEYFTSGRYEIRNPSLAPIFSRVELVDQIIN